jgi:hypothetical protein
VATLERADLADTDLQTSQLAALLTAAIASASTLDVRENPGVVIDHLKPQRPRAAKNRLQKFTYDVTPYYTS